MSDIPTTTPRKRPLPDHFLVPEKSADTPSKQKYINRPGADASLDTRREANVADVGDEVPVLTLDEFLAQHVPQLPPGFDAERIADKLRECGKLVDGGWKDYLTAAADPKNNEDKTYKSIEYIAVAIKAACAALYPETKPISTFSCLPTATPQATELPSTCKPDCYFTTEPVTTETVRWVVIAIPGEFKKTDKDIVHNRAQLAWDVNQTMRANPAKRFTIGITAEGTTMQFWYGDRASYFASKSFDFNKDYLITIRFFVAILYSPLTDLGWDSTVTPVPGTDQYDIVVHTLSKEGKYTGVDRVFRTKKLLSADKVGPLRGRGTRVWLCVELDADGKETDVEVVLKDTWVDVGRPREGDTRDAIVASADAGEERDILQRGFLSVVCHGDVLINGKVDRTTEPSEDPVWLLINDLELSTREQNHREKETKGMRKPRTGAEGVKKERLIYHPKFHYRVVFSEVCTTFDETPSLSKNFRALAQLIEVLAVMHRHGWVHRDISVTNVLMVGDQMKLADLEYAKKYSETDKHRVRTANLLTLPVEADDHEFRFLDEGDLVHDTLVETGVELTSTEIEITVEFRYLPFHDLEAVWWLSANLVVSHEPLVIHGDWAKTHPGVERQKKLSAELFYDLEKRWKALNSPDRFSRFLSAALHPDIAFITKTVVDHLRLVKVNLMASEMEIARSKTLRILAPEAYHRLADSWNALATLVNVSCDDVLVYHFNNRSRLDAAKKAIREARKESGGRAAKRARLQ